MSLAIPIKSLRQLPEEEACGGADWGQQQGGRVGRQPQGFAIIEVVGYRLVR